MSDNTDCLHVWGTTGNSRDGDAGCGGQAICTKCSLTRWFYSKGPNLAFMMHRAYNAFLGDGSHVSIPDEERQKWLRAVKAVIETPHLLVTLQQGDTTHAYPNGVIKEMARSS